MKIARQSKHLLEYIESRCHWCHKEKSMIYTNDVGIKDKTIDCSHGDSYGQSGAALASRPARTNGSKRVRWVFVHSKHLEVPNARLKFDLHLPQRRPERPCAHCSSVWSSCSQSEVGLQTSCGQLSYSSYCDIVSIWMQTNPKWCCTRYVAE